MSELDIVKERIAYLKVWMGILVVTNISLFGWFLSNLANADTLLLAASVTCIVFITTGILSLHRRIQRYIESLRKL